MFGHSVYQIGGYLARQSRERRVKVTKAEALEHWRSYDLPAVKAEYEQDGIPDYPARSESWSVFTDGLCKDGKITLKQYETWSSPPECGR